MTYLKLILPAVFFGLCTFVVAVSAWLTVAGLFPAVLSTAPLTVALDWLAHHAEALVAAAALLYIFRFVQTEFFGDVP